MLDTIRNYHNNLFEEIQYHSKYTITNVEKKVIRNNPYIPYVSKHACIYPEFFEIYYRDKGERIWLHVSDLALEFVKCEISYEEYLSKTKQREKDNLKDAIIKISVFIIFFIGILYITR